MLFIFQKQLPTFTYKTPKFYAFLYLSHHRTTHKNNINLKKKIVLFVILVETFCASCTATGSPYFFLITVFKFLILIYLQLLQIIVILCEFICYFSSNFATSLVFQIKYLSAPSVLRYLSSVAFWVPLVPLEDTEDFLWMSGDPRLSVFEKWASAQLSDC